MHYSCVRLSIWHKASMYLYRISIYITCTFLLFQSLINIFYTVTWCYSFLSASLMVWNRYAGVILSSTLKVYHLNPRRSTSPFTRVELALPNSFVGALKHWNHQGSKFVSPPFSVVIWAFDQLERSILNWLVHRCFSMASSLSPKLWSSGLERKVLNSFLDLGTSFKRSIGQI